MQLAAYAVQIIFFFFSSRRRHTRLQGDWSSDVCSSDLRKLVVSSGLHALEMTDRQPRRANRRPRSFPSRSEEHTSELQSPCNLVCRLLLEKKKKQQHIHTFHLVSTVSVLQHYSYIMRI